MLTLYLLLNGPIHQEPQLIPDYSYMRLLQLSIYVIAKNTKTWHNKTSWLKDFHSKINNKIHYKHTDIYKIRHCLIFTNLEDLWVSVNWYKMIMKCLNDLVQKWNKFVWVCDIGEY